MPRHAMFLAAALLCATGNVHAQSAPGQIPPGQVSPGQIMPMPAPVSPAPRTQWYGWQILVVDVSSIVSTPVVPPLGVLGMYLGGPLVHTAHGQGGRALLSGGLRVGLTLSGAALGYVVSPEETCWDCPIGSKVAAAILGSGIGLLTAMAIDWFLLGKKTVVESHHGWTPTASVTPQGVNVGLMGRF